MLLCKIAHEQLLDLQTSGIPPSQTNQESVSSGAASETGCLSVQKKPLLGIFQRRARDAKSLRRVVGKEVANRSNEEQQIPAKKTSSSRQDVHQNGWWRLRHQGVGP